MRKSIYILPLLALLSMMGCVKEQQGGDTPLIEGEKAIVKMRFTTREMDVKTRAGLPADKEQEIQSIAVLIFDNTTGILVSENIHESAGVHSSSGTGVLNPNGVDYIEIESQTGNNQDIYVIANYHSNQMTDIKAVTTLSDMNSLIVNSLGNPLDRVFGLCKIGVLLGQQVRKNTDVKVELRQLSAKITVNVINKSPELTIEGWSADGLPMKTYAVERAVNLNDPNYHDAVDVKDSGNYSYLFTDQNFSFETKPSIPGVGSPTSPKQYSSTFYMFENRRGGRVNKLPPPDGWPNGDSSKPSNRKDYQLKAWYAPENATRIRIFGQTSQGTSGVKSFVLNHFLGENNSDNYDVRRATHYIYTITINGLDSIDIDTNIEQEELVLEVHASTDLMNIDSHFSSRIFGMHTDDINDPNAEVSMEVLQSANSAIHPDWLNITTVSQAYQHVRKNSDPQIALWQQEGEDNTYVRPKFIPCKLVREQLGNSYNPPAGVILGSEAYPYDDTSLPYEKAHHRMCKKITSIPTKGNTSGLNSAVFLYLCVDEYPFESASGAASFREAVVKFTVTKPLQEPRYIYFTIRQYPPYRFAATPDGNGVMLVERMEEYEHITHAVIPLNLQITSGMQWGKYDLSAAVNINNGYENTLWAVYQSITGRYYAGTNYRSPKYGSNDGGWDRANNGIIREGAGVDIQTTGAPYNNLPTTEYTNAFHKVYNMSAARYCHEKNNDINGDGNIDASETFWYLPASGEVQLFWTYREVINLKDDYYWSSTQADADNAYAFSMLHSPAAANLTYSGVSMKLGKTYSTLIGPPRVRCVRRASGSASPIQPVVAHRIDGTTIIDCSTLSSDMYTTTSKNNIAQGNAGAILNANRQVFKKLEIQSKENAAINYSTLHAGSGKCDESKGWRLPTQREMLLIYSVKDKLVGGNFQNFANDKYWTMSRGLNAHYIVNFKSGLAEYGNFFGQSYQFGYRCVREIQ